MESELHPDIFLLDDGFQHVQLKRKEDIVLIDAQSGRPALHFSQIADAKNRTIYDSNNVKTVPLPGTVPVDDDGILLISWSNGTNSVVESGWWQPHLAGLEADTEVYGRVVKAAGITQQ